MNLDRVPREGVIDDGKTRYKLIRCIGRGGSSLIYEAKAINSYIQAKSSSWVPSIICG